MLNFAGMNGTEAIKKEFEQIREERRFAPAIRVGYYFKTPSSESASKIQEEVGMIADYGTTGLNIKSDVKKLAECICANSCEMLNMDMVLSRHIRRLRFWQRVQWFLICFLLGAAGMLLSLR